MTGIKRFLIGLAILVAVIILLCCFGVIQEVLPIKIISIILVATVAVYMGLSVASDINDNGLGASSALINDDVRRRRRDRLVIVAFVLAVKVTVYILVYVVARITKRVDSGFFETFEGLWSKNGTDAPSYIGIAQNWYVTEGDPMYHIVFFPFYPILVRLMMFIIPNGLAAAVTVSALASVGAGLVGYELIRMDYSRNVAMNFILISFTMLGAFFYNAPMTESVFLLLSLLCLFFARKRVYTLAALFGMLAAFTRSPGILLAVPVGIELIREVAETKRNSGRFPTKRFIGGGLCIAAISLGLIAYLAINYSLWGNAFQFSIFQKEHWSQELGAFYDTAGTLVGQFRQKVLLMLSGEASDYDVKLALALWMPQIIAFFGSLAVVIITAKHLKTQYLGYFTAYFVITMGATWLLSSPRYIMVSVAVPLALAIIAGEKTWSRALVCGACALSGVMFLCAFAIGSPIY